MLLSIENLICDSSIIKLQETKPLEVIGYSNLKVIREKGKYEFLTKIVFKYDEETITTPLLQPEVLSFFPLKSKLYQGKIITNAYEIREIEINFNKIEYSKFKYLKDINIKSILSNKFEFNPYTFYTFYENIYIPTLLIGQYFYFPNTNIRRLFANNDIYSLIHQIDCKDGNIIFKNNVKFNEITAIITYLFQCNNKFSKMYSQMYKYNIFTPLQKAEQENNYLQYLPTFFKFPEFNDKYKLLIRGEEIDGYFIVYEILNFDFTQITNLEELKVSYKGKKQIKTFKTHSISSKIPKNRKNFSQTEEYNTDYLKNNLSLLEIDSEIMKKNLKVKKDKPISYNEYFSNFNNSYENIYNDGITLGSHENKNSKYGKTSLSIEKTNLDKIVKELEKYFNNDITIIEKVNNGKDYNYAYFNLKLNNDNIRECLLIRLNRDNTAWFILSTNNPPLFYKALAYHLLQIKDNKSEKYKNNNEFSREILKKYGICFHTSLKNSAKSFEAWINRLINKLYDWKHCKGIK
jgi:hypothetical protein